MEIGQLLENARLASGSSIRSLAAQAGVAGSTITRIQAGTIDPSLGTVERILGAAGFELTLGARNNGAAPRCWLGDLAGAWRRQDGAVRLNWSAWRGLLDQLALHPEWVPEAIYLPPPPAGGPVIDALLAAVAEKLADDAGLPRPSWTAAAPTLDVPFRPRVGRSSDSRPVPHQLERRGLMIDTESLWRNRETIGV